MSMLDYGDIPHMHTSSQCLHTSDTICNVILGFIISCKAQTPCMLGMDGLLSPSTGLFTVIPSVVCYHYTYAATLFGKLLVAPKTYNCREFSMSVLNW